MPLRLALERSHWALAEPLSLWIVLQQESLTRGSSAGRDVREACGRAEGRLHVMRSTLTDGAQTVRTEGTVGGLLSPDLLPRVVSNRPMTAVSSRKNQS